MSYDRALTVFSPDGHLFQVEYAMEAVNKGATAVSIRGKDCIVFAVEKKTIHTLQDPRTIRKIYALDSHIFLTFSGFYPVYFVGLNADARVLVDNARIECQSHRLTFEDPPTVEYIARHIASLQQKYTQRGGARPFGISAFIAGFDPDGTPRLYLTEPSGTHTEWIANSIGQNSSTVREFLEKFAENKGEEGSGSIQSQSQEATVQLAVRSLLEVVQSGASSIDIAVITKDTPINFLSVELIQSIIQTIEKEKEAELERKRRPLAQS